MRALDIVIGVCWVAFWIYWVVAAVRTRRGRTQWGSCAALRVASVVVVLLVLRLHAFRVSATSGNLWLGLVGFVLFAAGLLVAIWARVNLGRNWGMPMSEKADAELVTSGPYRAVRHPIYSGLILAMVGTAVAVRPYWIVVALLLGAYFVYAAFMEERRMTAQFPTAYPPYRARTKMLVPFVL
jgi:protein-S-isoprenylcysteine O-methyltransferase Ste14